MTISRQPAQHERVFAVPGNRLRVYLLGDFRIVFGEHVAVASALTGPEDAGQTDGSGATAVLQDDVALTPRERQVALLITEGLTNRQIAARLGIGERTVNTHVHNILHRLDLTSRAQIVAWAVQRSLGQSDGADVPRQR